VLAAFHHSASLLQMRTTINALNHDCVDLFAQIFDRIHDFHAEFVA
jgi:hypothetical protein